MIFKLNILIEFSFDDHSINIIGAVGCDLAGYCEECLLLFSAVASLDLDFRVSTISKMIIRVLGPYDFDLFNLRSSLLGPQFIDVRKVSSLLIFN